jgi:hypothetical protein
MMTLLEQVMKDLRTLSPDRQDRSAEALFVFFCRSRNVSLRSAFVADALDPCGV